MHEDLLKEQHLEAMRQLKEENRRQEAMRRLNEEAMRDLTRSASLANMQDPQRPLEPGEWRDCTPPADPVDLSPLHGPNYRNLPAFLAGRDRVIIAEICEHLGIRYSRAEAIRIGRELRARAWRPALWRVEGKTVSGFQKPRKVKGETGLVYSQFARLLAQAAMCQPQDELTQMEWEKRAKSELVSSDAAPPPVGFWRRLLNLLTGGDR